MSVPRSKIYALDNKTWLKLSTIYIPTIPTNISAPTFPEKIAQNLYDDIAGRIKCDKTSAHAKIVYLKHTRMTSGPARDLYGLEMLEEAITNMGGLNVDPLNISFEELICTLKNARLVIGQDSSVLHNLAFSDNDLFVLDSIPRATPLHMILQRIRGKKLIHILSDRIEDKWVCNTNRVMEMIHWYREQVL